AQSLVQPTNCPWHEDTDDAQRDDVLTGALGRSGRMKSPLFASELRQRHPIDAPPHAPRLEEAGTQAFVRGHGRSLYSPCLARAQPSRRSLSRPYLRPCRTSDARLASTVSRRKRQAFRGGIEGDRAQSRRGFERGGGWACLAVRPQMG